MLNNYLCDLPTIEIETNLGTSFVHLSKILYIKANNKKSIIHFADSSTLEVCHMLKWFEKRLPEPEFYRCHNSYICNCLFIKAICGYQIIIGNHYIPLARNKKQSCKDTIAFLQQKIAYDSLQKNTNHSEKKPPTPQPIVGSISFDTFE